VRIANWPQGRVAALSIRFDDSHPTHLSKAIPILREYGFKGTFMVNPGPKEPGSRQSYSFETQHAEWEAVMKQGDMELANHSAHHRGARGDDEMESEIGSAAAAIWKLTPGKSKLMALNLGGGTRWETTRTLRHYLDKYHQFDASSGSLGMDDSYGGRVEAFRKALRNPPPARPVVPRALPLHRRGPQQHRGQLPRRARHRQTASGQALDRQAWQTSTSIKPNATARKSRLVKSDAKSLTFQLDCHTDVKLYDQSLTLEITPAAAWDASKVIVKDDDGQSHPATIEGTLLRCTVPPREGAYSITSAP
jgi:hypothetical protein